MQATPITNPSGSAVPVEVVWDEDEGRFAFFAFNNNDQMMKALRGSFPEQTCQQILGGMRESHAIGPNGIHPGHTIFILNNFNTPWRVDAISYDQERNVVTAAFKKTGNLSSQFAAFAVETTRIPQTIMSFEDPTTPKTPLDKATLRQLNS